MAPSTPASSGIETVEYFNPNTGTTSEYELEVDRDSDGRIQRINFPNEGWIEIDGDTVKNGDGSETYTRYDGAEYTIQPSEAAASTDETDTSDADGD